MNDISIVGASVVTTSDSATLSPTARGLYVGGAGNVNVDLRSGTSVVFSAIPAGTFIEAYVTRVYATGTSATSILALY